MKLDSLDILYIQHISVVDPHHVDADPDPRIRIGKKGSSSW